MNELDADAGQLDAVLTEYAERLRRGEQPAVEEYVERYPALGPVIQELLPTIQHMEELKRRRNRSETHDAPGNTPLERLPQDDRPLQRPDDAAEAEFDRLFGADPATDQLGRLGSYRILSLLGRGGMGAVYVAEDVRLRRLVALKVMLPEVARRAGARERFLREARAAAAIEHDHIVAIYQVDEFQGVPFIAMPLLQGASLEDRLQDRATFRIDEIVQIGRDVARGLAAAHARGLIHRDVKPENIWLEAIEDGIANPPAAANARVEAVSKDAPSEAPASFRAKLLDFGLARDLSGEAQITGAGIVVGTPLYMAPEQARGDATDGRADLFSLGVVLYRLCTGKLPFGGGSALNVMMSLAAHEPAAPHALSARVPKALSELVMALLEKDPARRPASAQEVVRRLHQLDKPAPKPRRRAPLAAALVLLGLLAPLGYFLGGTVLRFATNQGELIVEIDDPAVELQIVQEKVILVDRTRNRQFTFSAGKGEIHVWEKDGPQFTTTKPFQLTRAGRTTVTVRLAELQRPAPLAVAPAMAPPSPETNGALQFDGKSTYVKIPSLKLDARAAVTLEAWIEPVRPTDLARPILALGDKARCRLTLDKLGVSVCDYCSNQATIPSKPYWPAEYGGKGLIHLAYVAFRGEGTVFLNGVEVGRGARGAAPDQGADGLDVWLGGLPPSGSDAAGKLFEGQVDEVRISNCARYLQNFLPARRFSPDMQTVALYHCDEGGGDVLQDSSGNNHHGQVVNALWAKAAPVATLSLTLALTPFDAAQANIYQETWAKHWGAPIGYENAVGMKFRLIPPGDVLIDRKLTRLSNPYYMGTTEVTVGQFRQFVKETKYKTAGEKSGKGGAATLGSPPSPQPEFIWSHERFAPSDQHPVAMVTLADAMEFCEWLNAKDPSARHRVPSEAEWAWASRAGSGTSLYFGRDLAAAADHGWDRDNAGQNSHAVGGKRPNAWGLFDVYGNLNEWCADGFENIAAAALADPEKPPSTIIGVVRGTSFAHRGQHKFNRNVGMPFFDLGFRVLREANVSRGPDKNFPTPREGQRPTPPS